MSEPEPHTDPAWAMAERLYMAAAEYIQKLLPPGTPHEAVQSTRESTVVVGLCRELIAQTERIAELERRVSAIDDERTGKWPK